MSCSDATAVATCTCALPCRRWVGVAARGRGGVGGGGRGVGGGGGGGGGWGGVGVSVGCELAGTSHEFKRTKISAPASAPALPCRAVTPLTARHAHMPSRVGGGLELRHGGVGRGGRHWGSVGFEPAGIPREFTSHTQTCIGANRPQLTGHPSTDASHQLLLMAVMHVGRGRTPRTGSCPAARRIRVYVPDGPVRRSRERRPEALGAHLWPDGIGA